MKLKNLLFLCGTLLVSHSLLSVPSFIKIRPEYTNTPYELFFKENCLAWESAVYIAAKYTQSFDNYTLSNYLFGADVVHPPQCASFLKIEGSQYNNGERDPSAWLADYFGLPTDYASTISFNPSISQVIIPLHVSWAGPSRFYGTLELTAAQAQWQLCANEVVINKGKEAYIAGYFNSNIVERTNLVPAALDFLSGTAVPDLGGNITFQPLGCSRIQACYERKKGGIAGLEAVAGWFFIADDNANCGIHLRAVAPGQSMSPCGSLFSPIIGNGGHWALGAGVDAITCLKQNKDSSVGLSITAYAQHLFSTPQPRCFDLRGKPNSRYMLAQKLGELRYTPSLVGPSNAGVEFQNEYAPVANITAANVSVSVPVEAEFTAFLSYNSEHIHWGVGYNLWGQSAENICLMDGYLPAVANQQWALKGDAQVIGFVNPGASPVRLAATQDATIHSGTNNYPDGIGGVPYFQNPGVLNPQAASTDGTTNNVTAIKNNSDTAPLYTSNPATPLSKCSLDLSGTQALSQKLFASFSYSGRERGVRYAWMPFIACGAEVEWGKHDAVHCCPNTGKFNCPTINSPYTFALTEWGAWLTLGVTIH